MLGWGIVGTGDISDRLVQDIDSVPGARIVGVWGRADDRVRAFADAHDIPFATTSLAELLGRPDIDVVYIATPAHTHADIAIAALRAGRHVLIEKPIATSAADAERVYAEAVATNRFAMEAMWMRFNPLHVDLLARISGGLLGEISSVRASFGTPFQARGRILTPADGGSILRDRGIYPITLTHWLLGAPAELASVGSFAGNTDVEGHATLEWSGAFAQLAWSGVRFLDLSATIAGERGWLVLDSMFWAGTSARIHAGSAERIFVAPERVEHPREGNGYRPMIAGVMQAIAEGRLEHPWHTHADSIAITRTMDAVLADMSTPVRGSRSGEGTPRGVTIRPSAAP